MIYHTIWVSIHSFKCFKTIWSGLLTSTLFSPCSYLLVRNGMLLKFLRILITPMYFKERNGIFKTVNCISCSMVCKIDFCSEFPDIPYNAGKVTRRRRRRRRTKAIAKRYATLPLVALHLFPNFERFFIYFKLSRDLLKITWKSNINCDLLNYL